MSSQHLVDERGLDDRAIARVHPRFKIQCKSYYLQLEEIFKQRICYIYLLNIYAVCYVPVHEGFMRKIFDMMIWWLLNTLVLQILLRSKCNLLECVLWYEFEFTIFNAHFIREQQIVFFFGSIMLQLSVLYSTI